MFACMQSKDAVLPSPSASSVFLISTRLKKKQRKQGRNDAWPAAPAFDGCLSFHGPKKERHYALTKQTCLRQPTYQMLLLATTYLPYYYIHLI
jgi:hypothetical protein